MSKDWVGYYLSVLPSHTILTPIYFYNGQPPHYHQKEENFYKNHSQTPYGCISSASSLKLKYAIGLLNMISKWKKAYNWNTDTYFNFKLNFFTLTLPAPQGIYTDHYLKNTILNNFLNQCKTKFGMKSYIWKAETQKNNNLHFHITTDTYIHYEKLKNLWNNCLRATTLIDQFKDKFGHENPNSTDIHSVKNIRNFERYLIKYYLKNETDRRPVEGKLWNCSKNLNYSARYHTYHYIGDFEAIDYITKSFDKSAVVKDYCTIFNVPFDQIRSKSPTEFRKILDSWLTTVQ